ncbi:hypothetical protein AKO1_006001 [Acrasis kona]|uniref:DUF1304 domain-containing protein n=1 Tax=Acrasis kona TaxID=1008807 RepID=A0AAW2YIK4_9EUKA
MSVSWIVAVIASGAVSLLHGYIMYLETFIWEQAAVKIFRMKKELAVSTKELAANQGYYNFMLSIGLIWGIIEGSASTLLFFNLCVLSAAVFGAVTSSPRILVSQGLPGFVGALTAYFALERTSLSLVIGSLLLLSSSVATSLVYNKRKLGSV